MLDEPIPGRPQADVSNILSSISAHKGAGGMVLIIEHDLKPTLPVIDKVLVLDGGRVCYFGTKEQFLREMKSPEHSG